MILGVLCVDGVQLPSGGRFRELENTTARQEKGKERKRKGMGGGRRGFQKGFTDNRPTKENDKITPNTATKTASDEKRLWLERI